MRRPIKTESHKPRIGFKVVSARVLLGSSGVDEIFLTVERDGGERFSPQYRAFPDMPLEMHFGVNAGTGVEYCRQNFGVSPEVLKMDRKEDRK